MLPFYHHLLLDHYPNGYFVGTINRVGIESELGENDFYGQSYFCTPRGEFVTTLGERDDLPGQGDPYAEELIIRDLNFDLIKDVRDTWQFLRDRRPDMYGKIVTA